MPADLVNWSLVTVLVVLVIYVLVVVAFNRYRPHGDRIKIVNRAENPNSTLGQTVKITTWNIGYAGLGRASDFVMDGGKNWLPPSRQAVKDNLEAICAVMSKLPCELFLLQEVSNKSPLSFWLPVRQRIIATFPRFAALFRPDISTRGLPWPVKLAHGTMTLCPATPAGTQVVKLPPESTCLAGIIKRNYALLVTRFDIEGKPAQWVIINLHLAAFDHGGATRKKQFQAVVAFARKEYQKGNFVVLGGDWNMALTKTGFDHTTDLKLLFWLIDLPREKIPPGWQIACDPTVPSVRTNYQPYVKGENYTTIIDGFIISPNVTINALKTTDTGFEHTDHMPVTATFSTKRP